ncbi:MAG: phosphoribosylanthranilate isomerase [Rhodospirillales bacterium]|nr:MAG: phosphoribosylanthranilate isomerase [Rhodospirillales bacterium]
MSVDVKICGLKDRRAVAAAVAGGARFVGFVFFPRSPRFVSIETAAALAREVPATVWRVGLVVDADDALLDAVAASGAANMLQLHGGESPERVAAVRERTGLPVIKAVAIGEAADVTAADRYAPVADRLLLDARPPAGADRPGGNRITFDWRLVRDHAWRQPWLLAGGLDADNLADAVAASGARAVDVSSGVEASEGVKSVNRIRAFLAAAALL